MRVLARNGFARDALANDDYNQGGNNTYGNPIHNLTTISP